MQVLIADDDRKTRELFSNYLMDAGHEPILATRGLDAVRIATAVYKASRYQSDAALKYGIDRYLIKPVSRETLIEAVADSESLIQPRPLFSGRPEAPAGMTGTSK